MACDKIYSMLAGWLADWLEPDDIDGQLLCVQAVHLKTFIRLLNPAFPDIPICLGSHNGHKQREPIEFEP